jgi:VanZ family protein
MFIPGRIADIYDWLADVIGGSFGIVLSYFVIMLGQKNKLQNIS